MARLAARCLSAIVAYDQTEEAVENLDAAQAKFDDILNSPTDVACENIKSQPCHKGGLQFCQNLPNKTKQS